MTRHEASLPVTRLWLALPYLLVVASAILTVARGPEAQLPVILALCVGVLIWHTWWAVLHPDWLEHRTAPMLVYFVGMLAGSAWLFHLSFSFMLLYLVCFALAFVALPGPWAYLGVGLTVGAMLLITSSLSASVENVVVTLAGGVVTIVAGWSIRTVETESAGRRAALADLEQALAANTALQAELVETAHQQGIARERTRIAAEIHDTLAADLAGVVAQLEALAVELREPRTAARVTRSLDVARTALQQARTSVTSMRLHTPGDGLADAIDRLVRRSAATSATEVSFAVDGDTDEIPDATADALMRVTGEALRNALRHADAGSVVVTLSFLGEAVTVHVVDDGRGFDPEATEGNGLAIVGQRLAEVGGRLEISSTPGSGTTLTLIAPLGAGAIS
ncbi:sensor histidine kinase [Pseudactinotalea sp.]|uniref:sensor histidine kinase n=1 Tax=Pseudactinotalea sp. TaxID=1926260 RepID=UPI003B3B0E64